MRIYHRDRAYKAAQEARERLNRRWRLHRAPLKVACRQTGLGEDAIRELARRGRIKTSCRRDGKTVYDLTVYLGM